MRTPKTVYALFKQGIKRWTKGAMARTSRRSRSGKIEEHDKAATCFCALGAIRRVYGFGTDASIEAITKLADTIRRTTKISVHSSSNSFEITNWNDKRHRTFQQVLQTVKRAAI